MNWKIVCVAGLITAVVWYNKTNSEEKRHEERIKKFKQDVMNQFREMQNETL